MKRILSLSLLLLLIFGQFSYSNLRVKKDRQNVTANGLIGRWSINKALSKRLRGNSNTRITNIEFREDINIVTQIPSKYFKFLSKKRIYLSGYMLFNDKKHPFILIEFHGNPYIVYFRPRNGHPMGDGESFNVMFAKAENKSNDILFIGGDFAGESYRAFNRMD